MNLDPSLQCIWLDDLDYGEVVKHWVVYAFDDLTKEFQIAATARLTVHHSQDISQPRDVALWLNRGIPLSYPVCDMGRLVVHKQWRKRGIANELNRLRVEFASREFGAKMIIATASQGNARLLERIGFKDIGEQVEFDDRPGIIFSALQLLL
jgi:predicted GNAT family N-acyltransferase